MSIPAAARPAQRKEPDPLSAEDEENSDEAAAEQVDKFMAKLKEHQRIVLEDSGKEGPGEITILAAKGAVLNTVRNLERRSLNPREALLKALQGYKEKPDFDFGDLKARVAPQVLATLFKGGRTAKQEMGEWSRNKQLDKCQAAGEAIILAMVLDRMLESGEDLVNNESAELLCRRLYAILKAYEKVQRVEDWQRPKNKAEESGSQKSIGCLATCTSRWKAMRPRCPRRTTKLRRS